MIRRFRIELITVVVLLSTILMSAGTVRAADWGRMPIDSMRHSSPPQNTGYTRQSHAVNVAPGFTVSSSPKQFYIGYLFDGSGKGWWTGNSLASITITRNDTSQQLRFRTLILVTAGNQYTVELPQPGLSSFTVTFDRIPVFLEENIRLACTNILYNRGVPTYQAIISIKGLAVSGAGSEQWYTIAETFPVATSLQCQRVTEYAK